jgi:protein-S-isoprenylcysteine O-methyltransferase Ste14
MSTTPPTTPLAFRLRLPIVAAIYGLGFWAPGFPSESAWLGLSSAIARTGHVSFTDASLSLAAIALVLAVAGAFIRTWADAWLGADIVHSFNLNQSRLLVAGPFGYVRNPLYLGLILQLIATALFMPIAGSIFAVVAMIAFAYALILGEEPRLHASIGDAFTAYTRCVPRLFPRFTRGIAVTPDQGRPVWTRAFAAELYYWGACLSIALFAFRYQLRQLITGLLLSFGASLILRAIILRPVPPTRPAQQ